MSTDPIRLLLVEDDSAFRKVYVTLLKKAGFLVEEADDRPSARAKFRDHPPEVVILDLMLPPDGTASLGLAQLAELKAERPECKVIVVSGAGDTSTTVEAVRQGAYDFLTKPIDPDVFLIVIERAAARTRLEAHIRRLESQLSQISPRGSMVGESEVFLAALRLTERIAKSELPVLVTGENGTGKELLARSIHDTSQRADKKFVAVNCGAIPETLLESTFFGHLRGSFTGATRDAPGLFREADGGTLFLDEIGDMPPTLQVKVLRAVEAQEILPVGASESVKVDVRIVSATHRNLTEQVEKGLFREDLYWRIRGAEINLPPLRERIEDLPLLAAHFLNRSAHLSSDGGPRRLSDAALEALKAHRWPGNLRELRHEMQRASVFSGSRREVEPEDLSFTGAEKPSAAVAQGQGLHDKVEALEKKEIQAALSACQDNRSKTAELLGLSRQGLLKKMERYGFR